jgi:YegS/Rv2252/BmrU family lipid kinase
MLPVIVNGAAGRRNDGDAAERLIRMFSDAGAPARLVPVRRGDDLVAIAASLARERPAAIVAAGGDGTVSAVASAIAGTGVALGVLPLGTLNHFAKDLGIPLDTSEAVRTIAAGRTIAVDVGAVNGRIFINNSSLGLYPHIVRDRDDQQRRLGRSKWYALAWATLTAVRRSRLLDVRMSLDDGEQQCSTRFIFIGNNTYTMEGFNIGARERLDAGHLSIYLSRRRSRLRLMTLALRALVGRLRQAEDFVATSARTLVIETRRRPSLHVATDGEVTRMTVPLEYEIRPGALRVIVPAPAQAA